MSKTAFPHPYIPKSESSENSTIPATTGLTKREYFVAAALTGMCANPYYNGKDVAQEAKDLADRILKLIS